MESEVKSPTLSFNAQSAAKLRIGEGSETRAKARRVQVYGTRNGTYAKKESSCHMNKV